MEKRLNKKIKAIGFFSAVVVFGVGLVISFSPYGKKNMDSYPMVEENIIIEAPIENVFDYLGDSENAASWSVYVDHIETMNKGEVPDGLKGSVRRCFVQEDKEGMQWDEEIISVIPKKKRIKCV